MPVKVHIHATHRQYTNGLEVVEVAGGTVGECLHHLIKQFPGMEDLEKRLSQLEQKRDP